MGAISRSAAAAAVLAAVAAPAAARAEQPPTATDLRTFTATVAGVVDGDTVDLRITPDAAALLELPARKPPRTVRLRLYGIDAPEKGQPFAQNARQALSEMVLGKEVVVAAVAPAEPGPLAGLVYVEGSEINEPLVSRGYAWASRRSLGKLADDPRFCLAERDARRGQAGLWRLPTKERRAPWEHRDAQGGRAVRFTDFDGETAEACLAAFGKR
jgi:endonuclease YncB( thermonuclease family)